MNHDEATLRDFLDHAYDEHPAQPRRIAEALLARAAALPADDEGAEAVRLAEHVMLGHLADADALRRFEAALPAGLRAHEGGALARRRIAWALAQLDGGAAPALPDAARWRALQNVVLALALTGSSDAAAQRLRADEAAAASHPDAAARQAYAACANNVALELRLGRRGDAARDALMLEAAAAARRAWGATGTWLHAERADYQLALCHAVLGRGPEALAHARACLESCEAHGADAAERFFAHEAMLQALRAAGDDGQGAVHRQRMQALLNAIEDPGMRDWCRRTLDDLPA